MSFLVTSVKHPISASLILNWFSIMEYKFVPSKSCKFFDACTTMIRQQEIPLLQSFYLLHRMSIPLHMALCYTWAHSELLECSWNNPCQPYRKIILIKSGLLEWCRELSEGILVSTNDVNVSILFTAHDAIPNYDIVLYLSMKKNSQKVNCDVWLDSREREMEAVSRKQSSHWRYS